MRLNRCEVMRVKLWERFGIVRQARGVDILSELVVGVCPEESYSENHCCLRARPCWWNWIMLDDARGMRIKTRDWYGSVAVAIGYARMAILIGILHGAIL